MSFWGNILSYANPARWLSPVVTFLGGNALPDGMRDLHGVDFDRLTVAELWGQQPHLRTVVSFRARNIAHLGLHVFERVSDTDRKRDHSSPLAQALRAPDFEATIYDTLFALVGDLDLHDRAYWVVVDNPDAEQKKLGPRYQLRRLPPSWVHANMRDPWQVKEYVVRMNGRDLILDPSRVIHFGGYSPTSPVGSSPTIESLKETLREQVEASKYRNQVWKRGGRVSSVIERPKDAPSWTDKAAERFRADWYANYTGKGPNAGGTPILEDGMKLTKVDFSARDQQFVEASKLSLGTVAAAFHVNPTMVGQMDNANYSNVREFRKSLYGDTLGPTLKQIESVINTFLIPRLGMDSERFYVEFNIGQKLDGNFEEQATVMQTMVGAPIMTRNEGRAKFNMPAIDGGDELIVPLNVLEGGQASPTDSGSQNVGKSLVKSDPVEARFKGVARSKDDEDEFADRFSKFFARQRKSVMSRIFAKAESWWDVDRWNEELSELILTASASVVASVAGDALQRLGISDTEFNLNRTTAFRRKVAERIASQMNETTLGQVADALAGDDDDVDPRDAVGHVFDVAEDSRASLAGVTAFTTFAGFAVMEAARQSRPRARKRWIVTSGDPRASHAAMNGEEVGIDDEFSNGLKWPGSYGDAEEIANCRCEIAIVV